MCLLCTLVYPPALENSKNLYVLNEWVGGWVDECLYVYMDGCVLDLEVDELVSGEKHEQKDDWVEL